MKDVRDIFIIIACFFICSILLGSGCSKDNTDAEEKRSGLTLYTDYKTGLQYIGNPMGGITPRLTVDGKHMRKE